MNKLLSLAAVALVAACSNPAEEADDPPTSDALASDETASAEAGDGIPGTYTGTTESGESWTAVLAADGTFSATLDGETRSGTWAEIGEQACFYPSVDEGAEAVEECFTVGNRPGDGSLTVIDDEGKAHTISKRS